MNKNFSLTLYGNLEEINPVISKTRARIFYTGKNRNRTYISEEVAEQMLSTLPYTPIVGIFSKDDVDFTDHGESRDQAIPYGVVPENANISWEEHEDKDGVTRKYACCDVYLWTERNGETKMIGDKSLSMELHSKTMKGDWEIIDGEMYFKLSYAHFLGVCALGDNTEPCFEGAGFYNLEDKSINALQETANKILEYNKKEEESQVNVNYKLSFDGIQQKLFMALNPDFGVEGNYDATYYIYDCYNDYVVARNCDDGKLYRIGYSLSEDEAITLGEQVEVNFIDVTAEEQKALDELKAEKDSFTATLAEKDNVISEKENALVEKEASIAELNTQIEGLNSSLSEKNEELEKANGAVEGLHTQLEEFNVKMAEKDEVLSQKDNIISELNSFKYNIEREDKTKVIAQYEKLLDAEILTKLSEEMDNYSILDLEKELAYETMKANRGAIVKDSEKTIFTAHLPEEPHNALFDALKAAKENR